jgi:hypothetical protein
LISLILIICQVHHYQPTVSVGNESLSGVERLSGVGVGVVGVVGVGVVGLSVVRHGAYCLK